VPDVAPLLTNGAEQGLTAAKAELMAGMDAVSTLVCMCHGSHPFACSLWLTVVVLKAMFCLCSCARGKARGKEGCGSGNWQGACDSMGVPMVVGVMPLQ
jgi:hypothetical protein